LKAGPEFFRLFVDSPIPLKNVRINIPRTIGLFDDKFYMRTNRKYSFYLINFDC